MSFWTHVGFSSERNFYFESECLTVFDSFNVRSCSMVNKWVCLHTDCCFPHKQWTTVAICLRSKQFTVVSGAASCLWPIYTVRSNNHSLFWSRNTLFPSDWTLLRGCCLVSRPDWGLKHIFSASWIHSVNKRWQKIIRAQKWSLVHNHKKLFKLAANK